MDGSWTLPVVSTVYPAEHTTVQDSFLEIFPELGKSENNVCINTILLHLADTAEEFIIEQVRDLTTALNNKHSYCPATWTSRAYNLLRLGFPDLAIGDAYKAILLFDIHADSNSSLNFMVEREVWRQTKVSIRCSKSHTDLLADKPSRTKEYVEHGKKRASLIMAQALFHANCYIECHELLKDILPQLQIRDSRMDKLKRLAAHAQVLEDTSRVEEGDFVRAADKDTQEARRSGTILPQTYPWSATFVQRDHKTMWQASKLVREATAEKCYIAPSNIVDCITAISAVEKEALTMGIRAKAYLPENSLVMSDRTFLSGIDRPEHRCICCRGVLREDNFWPICKLSCCDSGLCGYECLELTEFNHYHLCGKSEDLKSIPELELIHSPTSSDTIAFNDLLYRLFAYLENHPHKHPLRAPALASMIPAYRNGSGVRFSWANDIKRLFILLQIVGINIFTDHGYDTWVLQTMQARLRNNVRAFEDSEGCYHVAVNLAFLFFNHSCDPNVRIIPDLSDSSRVVAIATKPILHNEELFINYLDEEDLNLAYSERQQLLKDWTGGKCQCARCRQERETMNLTKPKAQQFPLFVFASESDGDYEDEDEDESDTNVFQENCKRKNDVAMSHPAIRSLGTGKQFLE